MDGLNSKAIAYYDEQDYESAKSQFEQLLGLVKGGSVEEQNCMFNIATCLGALGKFAGALEMVSKIERINKDSIGQPDILYNKALCHYHLSNFSDALKLIERLLASSHIKYPELSLKSKIDRKILLDSCIVEALNLKAAILIKQKNHLAAAQCINDIPFEDIEEFDCATLHNQAICESHSDATSSIDKLVHLSDQYDEFVPRETLKNLIILYIQEGQFKEALEFMQANEKHIQSNVPKHLIQYLNICLNETLQTDHELLNNELRKFLDRLMESGGDDELLLVTASEQASLLWQWNQYEALENLLINLRPHLKEEEQLNWLQTNLAHTLYMQDCRYEDCAQLYEELTLRAASLADVNANIVCNLCVSYVLTGRNGDAELLIKNVEKDEMTRRGDDELLDQSQPPLSHLCQINLIIGTLYCIKYNYEFGVARMFKALSPLHLNLNAFTWWLVKRCLISMLDLHCKQIICVKDDLFEQVILFLIQCERHETKLDGGGGGLQQQTVAYEARYLRSILLTVLHD